MEEISESLVSINDLSNNFKEFYCDYSKFIRRNENYTYLSDYPSIKIEETQDFSILNIIIGFIFFTSFYLLLVSIILTGSILSIIYIVVIYIAGSIFQLALLPEPNFYLSRKKFDEQMEMLLNSNVKIDFGNNNEKTIEYPGDYTYDVTGTIIIPKDISYIKIGQVRYYCDKDIRKLCNYYKAISGTCYIYKSLYYQNQSLEEFENSYCIDSDSNVNTINWLNTFLCIFLLQWFNTLYLTCKSKKCITIYPAKLLTKNNNIHSPTNIYIHGKKLQFQDYIYVKKDKSVIAKLNKDYEDHLLWEKREKRRERREERIREEKRLKEKEEYEKKEMDRKNNTFQLSSFKNENYEIEVERIYNNVYVKLRLYDGDDIIRKTIDVGEYEPYAEEYEEDYGISNIYYPNGKDIKIEVLNYERKYIVKVGTLFTNSYRYKNN